MQIWVTTKIEPNSVSWNSKIFLAVDMNPLTALSFQLEVGAASFFIDEEKKVAVVFDKGKKDLVSTHNIAYIVGVDGILEEVDLGISANKFCYPLVCSYVPSLVQL
ncbi:putative F-box protein At3g24580 [Arabidopsis lyrata subsp. lyrata]|nr:putative F-box protein At3g24580 [Arabidopsis lyrata subsp. lyrata]|eukprot:XP_020871001.1 putative F-box protein At3g24580 [Arabidopsis lyrata subsp. lyrata]